MDSLLETVTNSGLSRNMWRTPAGLYGMRQARHFATSVPNTGSTARDHLANERTWLAWLRTSLAFTALGLGLERFELLRHDIRTAATQHHTSTPGAVPSALAEPDKKETSHPSKSDEAGESAPTTLTIASLRSDRFNAATVSLATILLAGGAALSVLGTYRYFRNSSRLSASPSMFGPAKGSVYTMSFVATSFSLLALQRSVAGSPKEYAGHKVG